MTIVRIDRPDYFEPLYYDFDDYEEFIDMIWDGISRGYPQMITVKEEENETQK